MYKGYSFKSTSMIFILLFIISAACSIDSSKPKESNKIVFTKSNQTLGNTRTFGLSIEDIDQDDDCDILICNYIGASKLWLNDGTGKFVMSRQIFSHGEAHDVGIADLNGDEYPDIFFVNHATPSKIYFNDGEGNFTDSGQNIGSTEEYPGMIVMGDIDNDGDVDAFISHYKIPNRLWLNDGKGNFTKSDTEFGVGEDPGHMELNDFNGDKYLDLFLCMTNAPDQVWLNDGKGNFVNTGQALGSSTGNEGVTSQDIDGDGDNDVIVANNKEGLKIWLNQNHTGIFVESGDYFGENVSLTIKLFDADLDGYPDLITTHHSVNECQLWLNDGKGNFTFFEKPFGNLRAFAIGCRDIDGDKDLDVVFGQEEGSGGNPIFINATNR